MVTGRSSITTVGKYNPHHREEQYHRSSLVAQQVKDPLLSLGWFRSLLWYGFNPWPRNFHMPWTWTKKREREREKQCIFAEKNTVYYKEKPQLPSLPWQEATSLLRSLTRLHLYSPCCITIYCRCVHPISSIVSFISQNSDLMHHPSLTHCLVPGNYDLFGE